MSNVMEVIAVSHRSSFRTVPLVSILFIIAAFFIWPATARAEGGTQIGSFNQSLSSGNFYVDILQAGEVINVSLQTTFSGYSIYDPLGNLRQTGPAGQLGSGSQGSCPTLNGPISNPARFQTDQPGAWRVVLNGSGYCWDISVTPNMVANPDPRVAAGRLWTLRYNLSSSTFAEWGAIDSDFYAMTPGGLPNTNYVWLLDLNKFSGNVYHLLANDLGLDPPYSGYSFGGGIAREKFPLYLAYPAVAKPQPATPPLASSLRFIDNAGVDVTISPGVTFGVQDSGFFEFVSDIDGTYALTIDTNRDGQFASGDRLLLGNAVRGLNRVQWDGRGPTGQVVAPDAYQAQLKLRGGEFHFIANDVETSGGPNALGLTIRQANPDGTFTDVRVYWDDLTYINDPQATSTLPDGAMSNTPEGHHTWGNFSGDSVGDAANLDTYVYGQITTAIIDAVVETNDDPVHSPQIDLDADDSSGATGGDYRTVWTADGSAQAVAVADSDLTISDGDSTQLTRAEITLTTPQSGDRLSIVGSLPEGISLHPDSTNTTLRLDGVAPIDDYISALGQIRFNNLLPTPDNTQRSISFVVRDNYSNGNTVIATIFPDSDGDGVSDVEEGTGDSDGDGIPDYLDTDSDDDTVPDSDEGNVDSDGDGLPDRVESNTNDQDGDGIPDYLDIDSDGDGIRDGIEGAGDTDGDGLPDYLDLDSDGDGIPDSVEGVNDADGDGIPNFQDPDSDNDNIPDGDEGYDDSEDDGIPDREESNLRDVDGDNVRDYLDPDSDGDGIPDGEEGTVDSDGDGIADYIDTDSDNDGIPDSVEGTADSDGDGIPDRLEPNNVDSDGDGVANHLDPDDDGDGLPTAVEGREDADGDGIPNYLDPDSDNDGLPDGEEGAGDADGDGIPNFMDPDSDGDLIIDPWEPGDSDNDGIPDRLENNDLDSDGDGLNNHLDDDDDGDGIATLLEGDDDLDGDGIPNYLDLDSDGDGYPDAVEGDVDSDNDGVPDYLDLDSDDDGIPDAQEVDGDSDGDGVHDRVDPDDDGDGIATLLEGDDDLDGDGIPNYLDLDSDGDGYPDAEEGDGDLDNDGTPDFLDDDVDGDGIPDAEEGDLDSDGDGVPDRLEPNDGDTDGDNIPDYLDEDDDGDGIPTRVEGRGDLDGDGIPNYLDLDSDGDGVPDADEGAVDDTFTVAEDSSGNILLVLDNDSDYDGDPLTIVAHGPGSNGGTITNYGSHFSYTPAPNFFGAESFVYSVSDGKGTFYTALVTVVVTNVNDAPVAQDDAATTPEDTPITLYLLDNDSDIDGDELQISALGAPSHGGDLLNNGDSVHYTPAANFFGTETFSYTVSDGAGGFDTATVTITVSSVNDDPVAVDDDFQVAEDSVNVELGVLANDSDPDGDDLSLTALTAPDEGGQATIDGGVVLYTPAPDFFGTETFTYTVADGRGGQATALVVVSVQNADDAPVGGADSFTVDEDTVANVFDVLANDVDVDDDVLTIAAVSGFSHGGSATIEPSHLLYTPAPDFFGVETFSYTVQDPSGAQDTVPVTVTVRNVNDEPVAVDDAFTVAEDSAGSIFDVLANDFDVDSGDTLTIESLTAPDQGGVATIDGAAVLYTPAADFYGTESFSYTVSDGTGGQGSGMVTVTVTSVNDDPVALDDAYTVAEDTFFNALDVLANDSDPVENDAISLLAVGAPDQGGVATIVGSLIRYTPARNFFGVETFSYSIDDGQGGQDSATVTVTVTNINDAPIAVDDAFTIDEDSVAVVLQPLQNDSDPDDDAISLVAWFHEPVSGAVSRDGDTLIYTPNPNFYGSDTITYTITDGNGLYDSAEITITVAPVNDPPAAGDDSYEVDEDSVDTRFEVLDNDDDPVEGDPLSITAVGDPDQGGAATIDGDAVLYTPAPDFFGVETFSYTIDDGQGGQDSATVTVTVNNVPDAPQAAGDSFTVDEDTQNNPLDVLTNDHDADGDELTLVSVSAPGEGGSAAVVGNLVHYSPAPDFFGVETFGYTVQDPSGAQDTGVITVTVSNVNDDPVTGDDAFSVDEDSVDNALNVLANDSDIDGDTLSVLSAGAPSHGSAEADGDVIRYTPDPDFFGVDSFGYVASDGNGGQAGGVVTVTVRNVNDAPTGSADSFTVDEDTQNNPLTVLANDSDIDGDELTLLSVGAPDQGGSASVAGNLVHYTPAPNFFGVETFSYTVQDPSGAQDTATVTVTVSNVNDAPSGGADAFTVDEDSVDNALGVLANDSDIDGDDLTLVSVSDPDQSGSASIDGDNVLYSPAPDFFGVETFDYTMQDPSGAQATATVTVTVTNVNDAPSGGADSFNVDEDTENNPLNVLDNDSDIDGDDLALVSVGAPDQGGEATIDGGLILYTPAPDFFGVESFDYTVQDEHGAQTVVTVTVTVNNVNDAPTGGADAFTVDEDSVDNALDVLANDADIDGDTLALLAVEAPDQGGSAVASGGVVLYSPAPDFAGQETFSYTVHDGNGGEDTATVTVTVANLNDAPVAQDDVATVAEDSADTVLDVLANDSDVDGDMLSLTAVSQPDQGGVTALSGDGVAYSPAPDFNGSESFSYTVSDGHGGEATATVTVTVTAVNDAPQAWPDGRVALQGQTIVITPLANDQDVDGDALSLLAVDAPDQGGSAAVLGDAVHYRSMPGFLGAETLSYTAGDGELSSSGVITVTVVRADLVGLVDPQQETTFVLPGEGANEAITATIEVAPGAMGQAAPGDTFALVYREIPAPGEPPLNYRFANFSFSLDAYINELQQPGFVFQTPITISLEYGDADVALLDESTLDLVYWDGASWQRDGISLLGHDAGGNSIRFSIAHLTDFALVAREPAMGLGKSVQSAAGGYLDLPLGSVVTYTLQLYNGGSGHAANVVLTDTLPSGVTFQQFVVDGGAHYYDEAQTVSLPSGETLQVAAGTVLWTGDLGTGQTVDIVFHAQLPGGAAYLGQSLTNTAYYRGDNILPGYDEATVSFVANSAPTISAIADQFKGRGSVVGPLSFTVADAESDPGALLLSARSSNQAVAPDGSISLGGDGEQRTITISPPPGATGQTTITIMVADENGAEAKMCFELYVVQATFFLPTWHK